MCGAFEQHGEAMRGWANLLRDWPPEAERQKNIRPTNWAGTVDAEGYKRRSWSLIPKWSKEPKSKYATFNARAETVHEKPAFRDAWRRSQRCVVPASAYFEWPVLDGRKQCHRLCNPDESPILFGGLWEYWEAGDVALPSFTVITTSSASDIDWVHPRTPLIIDPDAVDHWLTCSPEEAAELMRPRTESGIQATPVASPKD